MEILLLLLPKKEKHITETKETQGKKTHKTGDKTYILTAHRK